MSKFKKGDWIRENDAEPGDKIQQCGYRIHDVLPNGDYVVEVNANEYSVWADGRVNDCTVEPRCTGWDWVLPEPANRFALKVGDVVVVKAHDGKYHPNAHGAYVIESIEEGYSDKIARFRLKGDGGTWHPYWFGLCQSDGSPLPEKPTTKKTVLEEWVFLSGFDGSRSCSEAVFKWRPVGGHSRGPCRGWTKTGVTRELEVPNEV